MCLSVKQLNKLEDLNVRNSSFNIIIQSIFENKFIPITLEFEIVIDNYISLRLNNICECQIF